MLQVGVQLQKTHLNSSANYYLYKLLPLPRT